MPDLKDSLLLGSLLSFILSFAFLVKNNSLSSLFLFVSGILVYSYGALLDDFLNVWDERYHALVAKNMIDHPFKPMLYADPVLDQEYSGWFKGHVWLHKQPLFMWQMALSMKLFGANLYAMRLPGVIMSSLTVVALFRSGSLLFNRKLGFIAATLMLSSVYWLDLVSGRGQTDQNDVAFIAYISLSCWAFIEYYTSGKKSWILWIGVFSGAAILCKWLVGLLVYAVWGLYSLAVGKARYREWKNMALSLCITIAVFLPWQIYTSQQFPKEFEEEQAHNLEHLFKPLDHNHNTTFFYHYDQISNNLNIIHPLILIVGLLLFFFTRKNRTLNRALAGAYVLQFLFFSLALSKMPSFTLAGWFVAILAIAYGCYCLLQFVCMLPVLSKYRNLGVGLVALLLILTRFSVSDIEKHHEITEDFGHAKAMTHNKKLLSNLKLEKDFVLFNVGGLHIVDAMFYTGVPVYNNYPGPDQVVELKLKNRKIAVLEGKEELPAYILNDSEIKIIKGFTYVNE